MCSFPHHPLSLTHPGVEDITTDDETESPNHRGVHWGFHPSRQHLPLSAGFWSQRKETHASSSLSSRISRGRHGLRGQVREKNERISKLCHGDFKFHPRSSPQIHPTPHDLQWQQSRIISASISNRFSTLIPLIHLSKLSSDFADLWFDMPWNGPFTGTLTSK